MIDGNQLDALARATVYDNDGHKIGAVGQVFTDPATGAASWLTVKTGLFGAGESFVPATGATLDGDAVHVGYDKRRVKDAPRVDSDAELDADGTDALYRYYGFGAAPADHAQEGVTRVEEHLFVGTERVEIGRARLHKYVDTEQETITVPVTHDEVRIVSEPISAADAASALSGRHARQDEPEVVLTGDRVVVDREADPTRQRRDGSDPAHDEGERR